TEIDLYKFKKPSELSQEELDKITIHQKRHLNQLNLYKSISVLIPNKRVTSCDEGISKVKNTTFLAGLFLEAELAFLAIFKISTYCCNFSLSIPRRLAWIDA
ncbi:hypothetical protein, partial [Mycoplasmopsis bovis]|uniref:hypothetical protein n=1 Tax=Mycoplasmopsis bovis TaxID=28903 RepID=UPI003D269C3D